MNHQVLRDFNAKLSQDRAEDNFKHQDELDKIYSQVLYDFTQNYQSYRKFVPQFLESLEVNNPHSIGYSVKIFFELFDALINRGNFVVFDKSVMEAETGDEKVLEKMFSIIDSSITKDGRHRLSEYLYDLTILSKSEKDELAALIIYKLQNDAKKLFWDKEMVETSMMMLMFLRSLLVSLNNIELFYHAAGIFLDRLSTSEFFQAGRDLAEEIICASYNDSVPELGYFNSYRLYSNGSVHAALMYANLCMTSALMKDKACSDKFIKEIIWQGLKIFRNIGLYPYAELIYRKKPPTLNYSSSEKRSLDHTYFTAILGTTPVDFANIILDYLNNSREEILKGGVNDALPWLLTLYNVRRLYKKSGAYPLELDEYIRIFEMVVPAENIKKYKDIIDLDSEDLIKHLKESLLKLNETRYTSDFLYDNETALKISSRLLDYSFRKKDPSSFLLSMTLKSDYSILFRNKSGAELAPLKLPDINPDSLVSIYDDFALFSKQIPLQGSAAVCILGKSEGNLYELELLNEKYEMSEIEGWFETFNKLIQQDYFVGFTFEDTIKRNGSVQAKVHEDFEIEEADVKEKLKFARLKISDEAQSILIVKDMEISNFPHNLFLDQNRDFIYKSMPVTNVLSTEWMLQCENPTVLPSSFTKSVWIPVQSGDIPLNYLLSNIEDTLFEKSFNVYTNVILESPLSSDLNIICSHGARNISETKVIWQNDIPMFDIENLIGRGKILIFFVCHSGSMTTEFFRNNVASMVKKYIAIGYEAVIAPFWALDVTVPRYWLPEFLDSLENGLNLDHAVHLANMKVYERYPVPAAWACLHLYGNPNVIVETAKS